MKSLKIKAVLTGSMLVVVSQCAMAAPDWTKVPKRDVHVFHAGVTPIEWVSKKSSHSGTAGMKKGESCAGCHEEKGTLNLNFKRLADKELEPVGAPSTMIYPVSFQSAHDDASLYIRLTFKAPSGSANKADKDNEVKATVMFPDASVPNAAQEGCWATCHQDARTMPGADDKKTKYAADGSVSSARKMEGGALVAKAEGSKTGDVYTVTFSRKYPGAGKTIPFGLAIHADHASGRFHHVSLGYALEMAANGEVKFIKQ